MRASAKVPDVCHAAHRLSANPEGCIGDDWIKTDHIDLKNGGGRSEEEGEGMRRGSSPRPPHAFPLVECSINSACSLVMEIILAPCRRANTSTRFIAILISEYFN